MWLGVVFIVLKLLGSLYGFTIITTVHFETSNLSIKYMEESEHVFTVQRNEFPHTEYTSVYSSSTPIKKQNISQTASLPHTLFPFLFLQSDHYLNF